MNVSCNSLPCFYDSILYWNYNYLQKIQTNVQNTNQIKIITLRFIQKKIYSTKGRGLFYPAEDCSDNCKFYNVLNFLVMHYLYYWNYYFNFTNILKTKIILYWNMEGVMRPEYGLTWYSVTSCQETLHLSVLSNYPMLCNRDNNALQCCVLVTL